MLKEAIADAKAVRETAIANAKIALEEAFTPQLQSLLSKKLQAEMEGEDEDDYDFEDEEELDEELGSSEIGKGSASSPKDPAAVANTATTDLSGIDNQSSSVGEEDENTSVVKEDLEEGDYEDDEDEMYEDEDYEDEEEMDMDDMDEEEEFDMDDMEDEEDLDLEAVIAELESELSEEDEPEMDDMDFDDEDMEDLEEEDEMADAVGYDDPTNADDAELDTDHFDLDESEDEEDFEDDMVDLEEILREMGYGDDEDEEEEMEETTHEDEEDFEAELEEAYDTIKQLRGTINEVNLLNAKLLYANRLFKGYNLTNEQKTKVVENLDRTSSVREVKLVYATLAESMNFSGTEKKKARRISESLSSSRPSKSTAPKKEMITESSNDLAERFKQLAGINKKNTNKY